MTRHPGCIAWPDNEGGLHRVFAAAGRVLRPGFLACLIAALAGIGCVTPEAVPPLASEDANRAALIATRDARLEAFDRFRVTGGLGIWNDDVSHSARIDWRQQGDDLDISLAGPFGVGAARLIRDEDGARLQRGDAEPYRDASVDRLLQAVLGLEVAVPVDQLSLWIRGLPGHAARVTRDARGRLDSLRWRDTTGAAWQARILDYARVADLDLPSLVTARGAGYTLRLKLRDWTDNADKASAFPTYERAPVVRTDKPEDNRRLSIPGR